MIKYIRMKGIRIKSREVKIMKANSRAMKLWVTAIVCVLIVSVLCACLMACGGGDRNGIPAFSASINGYQQYVDISGREDLKDVVPVKTMLDETGLSLDNEADRMQIATNIYNMAVRNYTVAGNAAYMVNTSAKVKAKDVKSTGMIVFSSEELNVGLTSIYSYMRGTNGTFSQTVSGITQLALDGAIGKIADAIKGNFGYNIQSFSNDQLTAFRRGSNGGAEFPGEKGGAENYIYGAYCSTFPEKPGKMYTVEAAEPSTPSETEKPAHQWDPLEGTDGGSFENGGTEYTTGAYCAGWATYNFDVSFLDSTQTTVTYDASKKLYTIKFVYLKEKIDEACKYAKASLISDTKEYIELKNPTYTKCENTINVYDNGLIASWERSEFMASDEAKVVLSPMNANCKKGGETGNDALTVFSYDAEVDANALQLAALYWPELGTEKGVNAPKNGGYKGAPLDFSKCKFANLESYKPVKR